MQTSKKHDFNFVVELQFSFSLARCFKQTRKNRPEKSSEDLAARDICGVKTASERKKKTGKV
jgi:hypothetical protein